jgi:hypothetical protein
MKGGEKHHKTFSTCINNLDALVSKAKYFYNIYPKFYNTKSMHKYCGWDVGNLTFIINIIFTT